jgi:hypothetical protein
MSGHGLWIWEEVECLALRRAIAKYNINKPRSEYLFRRHLAKELGLSLNIIMAYIAGRKALDMGIAQAVHRLTGIPIQEFSPRLARDANDLHDTNQTKPRP